jgi:ribosomal protein S18 acetylase RimI-like enzyme
MTAVDPRGIRRVDGDAELAAAAGLISLSFDHLGANRYLVPSDTERFAVLRDFFQVFVEHAAAGHGEVWRTDDGSAVAVWFDRTGEVAEPEDFEVRLKTLAGPYLDRFAALGELLDTHHPTDPHWHLAFLAVHPERWGTGLGGALMRHTHARLDADGVSAYLEATNDDNRRVYRRHGYVDLEPPAVLLPDGTPFYRMWRPPVAAPAHPA